MNHWLKKKREKEIAQAYIGYIGTQLPIWSPQKYPVKMKDLMKKIAEGYVPKS